MKRSFCLVVIFLATQFLMAFLVTFVVNLPSLWRDGELNVSTLADNPSALGISMQVMYVILGIGFLMSAVACLFELVDALKDGKKQGSEE